MACRSCGRDVKNNAKQCLNCGHAILSPERHQQISNMSNGEWVHFVDEALYDDETAMDKLATEWEVKTLEFCQSCDDPYELHAFASTLNWDFGQENLLHVIRNPACDLGTAQRIFRLAQPDYYQASATREEVHPVNQDGWDFIMEVIALTQAKTFKTHQIHYDPAFDYASALAPDEAKWPIPDIFKTTVAG